MSMHNLRLNLGGVAGALIGAGGAAAILYLLSNNGNQFPARAFKLVIWALIGGAVLGNFLWSLFYAGGNRGPSGNRNVDRESSGSA